MKVGITTFGCDSGKSGMGQYLIHLLRALAALEDEIHYEVIAYEDEIDIFLPEDNRLEAVPIAAGRRHPVINVAWHQLSLPKLCRRRGYDVLFLPAGNRRVPLKVACPTVGTVHDFANLHVKDKYDPARMFYQNRVLPYMVRRLTQIITVSEFSKRDIIKHAKVTPERVKVILHGADPGHYHPRDRQEVARRLAQQVGIQGPYVFYVARVEHPAKNHVRLIRAFDQVKTARDLPHQLVLAGSDWSRADEVHQVAQKAKNAADIVFTGFVPDALLPDLYCGADVFVFPSLFEGFGMPVLEAMACGTPVACANTSSIPEVAGDAALSFDPYNQEEIAAALDRLLADEKLRRQLREKGLEQSGRFTWAKAARSTRDVLMKVA